MAKRNTQEPWERPNPRKKTAKSKGSRKLTPGQRAEARGRARQAGRKYPNLVDNMAVARKKKPARKTSAKETTSKKRSAKKSTAKKRTATKRTARQRPATKPTTKRSTKAPTAARKRR